MPQFPDIDAGDELSVELLRAMLPNIYTKAVTTPRVNATMSNDPELSGIPLSVGTHWVKFLLGVFNAGSPTPDVQTIWTFTGTWNNPVRHNFGPGAGSTGGRAAQAPSTAGGWSANATVAYGLNASTGYSSVIEESYLVVVTVAGDLALSWAQNTLDAANATNLALGSTCITRKIV